MLKDFPSVIRRIFLHIYKTLLNRHSFLGLLRHVLINMTFIFVWITTFKNAYRIDPSIRPQIRVKYLEEADHRLFDITLAGVFAQCIISICGYSWMYALTRRTKLSILAALPPLLLNILYAGTHYLCGPLDVFAWLSYGVIHFISPFLAAFWLWLFASPGAVSIFAWTFGIQNCLGTITHLSFPTAAPCMPGSAAGLVRADAVLGTHIYQNAFKASPLVFGAFSCCCFFFVARYSRKGACVLGFYVLLQWFSTIYLRHHWRIDLLGRLIYSAFVFSLFFRSLVRIDRAFEMGVSGANGSQRLFEGTRLQCFFDGKLGRGYEMVREDSEDGWSGRTSMSVEEASSSSSDDRLSMSLSDDLESAWVQDFGATLEN